MPNKHEAMLTLASEQAPWPIPHLSLGVPPPQVLSWEGLSHLHRPRHSNARLPEHLLCDPGQHEPTSTPFIYGRRKLWAFAGCVCAVHAPWGCTHGDAASLEGREPLPQP